MKTTKTIANSPHFLNHQTNPSLLILNPHVSLVYQIKRDRKSLWFGNWVIGFPIEFTSVASDWRQPCCAINWSSALWPFSLICLAVGLVFWIGFLGFWFWFCLEIWPPSQFEICPHQSHWIGLNTKTPTWLILGLFFLSFLFLFLFGYWENLLNLFVF